MNQDSCFYCDKNPSQVLDGRPLCDQCFKDHVEKKLKKHLRGYGIKAGSHMVASELAAQVLERVLGGLPLKISNEDVEPFDHLVTCETLDDECCRFLNNLFFGDLRQSKDPKCIPLFLPLTDDEVATYSSMLRLPFTPKPKPKESHELLKKLISFFPHVRNNLLKSSKELAACVSKEKSPPS